MAIRPTALTPLLLLLEQLRGRSELSQSGAGCARSADIASGNSSLDMALLFAGMMWVVKSVWWDHGMCRNIKTLFNFDPPVTDEEIRAASLQFVRKISGFTKPSKANEASFQAAVEEVAGISSRLLRSLETSAPPKNREEEAAKAKARAAERFGA